MTKVMKQVPYGKVITVGEIREHFAALSGADFTEPIISRNFCFHCSVGELISAGRMKPLLENTESKRGT